MTSLIVEIPQGKLQGKETKSVLNGNPYYSFLGIPYAKPPIGDLRFKPPQPAEKWEGIYDATFERDICFQKDFLSPQDYIGSENCLFLSVELPQLPVEVRTPKPVMVYIHGGAFVLGSAPQEVNSPDYLINHEVILVRIHYRLHALGFLNLDLLDCPGNAGLKDQTLALKWVKENISYFGGDPNNITIFGISSGGSSVNFHILSPLSKGLFNKAIVQCGTAFCPWCMTFDHKEMARKLGEKCGFGGGSDSDLLEYLKEQTARDIHIYMTEICEDIKKKNPGKCIYNPFSPSVEKIKENAFLPELPCELLKTADPIPLIYGLTQKEGIVVFSNPREQVWDLLNKNFGVVLRDNFKIEPSVLPEVSAKVKQHYFGDEEIGPDTTDRLFDLFSDLYFYHLYDPIERFASSSIPPFVYEFTYDGGLNFCKLMMPKDVKIGKGACHGDESGYIFYSPKLNPNPSLVGDDLTMIQKITEFWTNFAKTGKPTDESIWAPSTLDQPRYLKIDSPLEMIDGKVYGDRLKFLRDTLDPVIKRPNENTSDDNFPYYSVPKY